MQTGRFQNWLNNISRSLSGKSKGRRFRQMHASNQMVAPAEVCEARLLLTTSDGMDNYDSMYDDMYSDPMSGMTDYMDMYGGTDYSDAVMDSPMGDEYDGYLDEFDTYTTDAQATMEESLDTADAAGTCTYDAYIGGSCTYEQFMNGDTIDSTTDTSTTDTTTTDTTTGSGETTTDETADENEATDEPTEDDVITELTNQLLTSVIPDFSSVEGSTDGGEADSTPSVPEEASAAFAALTLSLLDDNENPFLIQPDGTSSFENTNTTESTVTGERSRPDETGELPLPSTTVTSTESTVQTYNGADDWTITQSVTNNFDRDEAAVTDDGEDEDLGRNGGETYSITITNGTKIVETWSTSTTFTSSVGTIPGEEDSDERTVKEGYHGILSKGDDR